MSEENRKIASVLANTTHLVDRKVISDLTDSIMLLLDAKDAKIDEAERRGAEEMRERAAKETEDSVGAHCCEDCPCWSWSEAIHALPLEGPKDGV